MKRALLTTFVSIALIVLLVTISYLGGRSNDAKTTYGMVLLFSYILIPIFLAASLYQFVQKRFFPNSKYYSILLGTLILFFVFQLCAVLIVIIDIKMFTIDTFVNEYKNEVAGFNIPVAVLALLITSVDYLLQWVRLDFKKHVK